MATMKVFKILVFLLGFISLVSCDNLMKDYELDTNPDVLSSMTLLAYIEQGKDTSLTLYAEAIKYANLQDSITVGNKTRIVPTNQAIRSVLLSAGVSQIKDLPPNVVKSLFAYLNLIGQYRSIDLEPDQPIKQTTSSGDPLILTRNILGEDRYKMVVNADSIMAYAPIPVIRQDYVFKDGIAHVVDIFPTFHKKIKLTDSVPPGVDYSKAKVDTMWVTEDSHAYLANKTANYNKNYNQLVSRSGQLRISFFKFGLKPIDFIEDLTLATMNMNVSSIRGSNFIPVVGLYDVGTEWNAATLNWNNQPALGQQIASPEISPEWNAMNITSFIRQSYQANKTDLGIGLQLLNGANITSSFVQIDNIEYLSGKNKAFIALRGAIPSELTVAANSPLKVAANGIASLSKGNISMQGSSVVYKYTDNNIIFSLIKLPSAGVLTKYGIPLVQFASFTQEELANGAIKYVHISGSTDSFELKAQDYIGGVYERLLPITVTIQ